MKKVLEARHINKSFYVPEPFLVLNDISFSIQSGDFVSVMGKSGCGKSTLLYILSTMDTAFEGELLIDGVSLSDKSNKYRNRIRNEKIGFVFQFHYLLPEFSVLKNVMLPALKLGKLHKDQIEANALEKLHMLGITKHSHKKASQLSGGEKQRVAIARALINDPLIIMGDEPTGNLDSVNSDIVLGIFKDIAKEKHQSLLIVTHDHDFAEETDRTIVMQDGMILTDGL
jgi:lipoprotein-releasing system ATP-binding protein